MKFFLLKYKKQLERLLILVLAVIFFFLAVSLIVKTKPPQVQKITLKNNLDFIFNRSASELVSVQAWVGTGAINENKENNGISHFLEHMMFKQRELVAAVEARGGYFNAATSNDFTYYHITLPKKHFVFAVKTLAQMLYTNSFSVADLEQEKNVILEEVARAEQNPFYKMYSLITATLYQGHPYALTVLGTTANIKKFTVANLENYYHKYYLPNNTTFVVAGNITQRSLKKAARHLDKYPHQGLPQNILREKFFNLKDNSIKKTVANLTTPTCYYVYLVPGVSNTDSYALDVLMYLIANRKEALLNKQLADKLALTYQISAHYQTRKKRSLFMIELPLKKAADADLVRREYQKIIKNIKFDNAELNLVKQKIKKEYYLDKEQVENSAYALGYYNTIANYHYELGYLNEIEKVSLVDLDHVITTYFKDENYFIFLPEKK